MGVRSATDIALPAFLSSAHSCSSKVLDIARGAVSHLEAATRQWDVHQSNSPSDDQVARQKGWDKIASRAAHETLLSTCVSDVDIIRLKAIASESAGAWLDALPSDLIGTRLNDDHFRAAAGLRLGLRLFDNEACPCGGAADELGHHQLSCSKLAGLVQGRHDAINDVLGRAFKQAGCRVTLEPTSLLRGDGKRPDGLTNRNWQRGKPLVWDVTVSDTFALGYRGLAMEGVGNIIHQREMHKGRLLCEWSNTNLCVLPELAVSYLELSHL